MGPLRTRRWMRESLAANATRDAPEGRTHPSRKRALSARNHIRPGSVQRGCAPSTSEAVSDGRPGSFKSDLLRCFPSGTNPARPARRPRSANGCNKQDPLAASLRRSDHRRAHSGRLILSRRRQRTHRLRLRGRAPLVTSLQCGNDLASSRAPPGHRHRFPARERIDGAYILVVLFFIGLGAYALSRWFERHVRHPAGGLLFLLLPGTLTASTA